MRALLVGLVLVSVASSIVACSDRDGAQANPDLATTPDLAGPACVGLTASKESAACQACVEQNCCAEVLGCHDTEPCWQDCYLFHDEDKCHANDTAHTAYHTMGACFTTSCAVECGLADPTPICTAPTATPSGSCVTVDTTNLCNPITNQGCATDTVCDANDTGGFECFPGDNTAPLCAACGESTSYCAVGMHCLGGKCARFCCDDSECGAGKCDKTYFEGGRPAGLCVEG